MSLLPSSFNQGIFADEKVQKFMLIIQSCFCECLNEMTDLAKSKSNNEQLRLISNYKLGLDTVKRWDNRLQAEEMNNALKKCPDIRNLYTYTGLMYVKLTHKDKIHMKAHLVLPPFQDFLYQFYLTIIDDDLVKSMRFYDASGLEKDNMFQNSLRRCLIFATSAVTFSERPKEIVAPIPPLMTPKPTNYYQCDENDSSSSDSSSYGSPGGSPKNSSKGSPEGSADGTPYVYGSPEGSPASPFHRSRLSKTSGSKISKTSKPVSKISKTNTKTSKTETKTKTNALQIISPAIPPAPVPGKSDDYWNDNEKGVELHPDDSLSNVNAKSFKEKYKALEKEALKEYGPALPLTKDNLEKHATTKNEKTTEKTIIPKTNENITILKPLIKDTKGYGTPMVPPLKSEKLKQVEKQYIENVQKKTASIVSQTSTKLSNPRKSVFEPVEIPKSKEISKETIKETTKDKSHPKSPGKSEKAPSTIILLDETKPKEMVVAKQQQQDEKKDDRKDDKKSQIETKSKSVSKDQEVKLFDSDENK